MHSGGANTSLKNNRNLLKRRKTRFRKRSDVNSLNDDRIKRDKSKDSLVTLSASERKAIGRKIRVRRRIEAAVILIGLGAIFYWMFAWTAAPLLQATTQENASVEEVLQTEPQIKEPQSEVVIYLVFARQFISSKQFKMALRMCEKALLIAPNNTSALQLKEEIQIAIKEN